jgi:DNA polymerase-3 subunit delta
VKGGVEALIERVAAGTVEPVYLLVGDAVLTEPAAQRLGAAIAESSGAQLSTRRRPASLGPVLQDLETYSLFGTGKVVVVTETALLADRSAAADLIDQAAEQLPIDGDAELGEKAREAGGRLLLALRLFGVDPRASAPADVVGALPSWALAGGRAMRGNRGGRGRGKKQVADLAGHLAELLAAALEAGLVGWAEGDAAELARAVESGLPAGHVLVLAESSVAADHPLVGVLKKRKAIAELGAVGLDRRGAATGLEPVVAELERETGVGIRRDALDELARRTLRKSSDRGKAGAIDPASTARLAAEYRKLAGLAEGGTIQRSLVVRTVEDRGEEDVWALLDDLGAGRVREAFQRLDRILLAAEDVIGARLSLFSLLADYCRQIVAVRSMLSVARVPAGERNYQSFQSRHVAALQAELPGGFDNPLAGLHPYRLHRVYLAASRLGETAASRLAGRIYATELRLKGESGDPDAALGELIAALGSGMGGAAPPARR